LHESESLAFRCLLEYLLYVMRDNALPVPKSGNGINYSRSGDIYKISQILSDTAIKTDKMSSHHAMQEKINL